ncbi:exported protein 2, putative [Plasmodium ovale]|uniref:Exported protein 2, putative n=2 Tax=Plasmodium ovale TaxID=36330 RepID=A0A1A8WXR2_PLAOA|nr:exported protein 2, putative [Plasmodium ovale curtisi]SBS96673.1 exported protein 2, putative [Plasmodium ovale curtisi]SCP05571.1 exported protein 2, putative [Plasmodium ovale]
MKISYILSFFLFLVIYKNTTNVVQCDGYSDLAATSALTTIVKDPISLTIKDLYEHGVKDPITKLIHKLKKVVRYRKVLRWSRIWWILLVREIVGDNAIEKKTEKALREIWDQCTIAVYNNTLYAIESKPLLFLHGILNECKNNFSTKLRQDPGLIVAKIDQILKSQIYRFWVSEPYLKLGRSSIFYTRITPKIVPPLPKECTLKHLSSYMEEKLKSMESKKNIESGKYEFDVESTKNSTNDTDDEDDDQNEDEDDDQNDEESFEDEIFNDTNAEEKKE